MTMIASTSIPDAASSMPAYFRYMRGDVLRHVPDHVRDVFSVGCGMGHTEAALAARGVNVVGVEINPEAAALARKHGFRVIEADALAAADFLHDCTFDCLLYADVLEHILDPLAALQSHVRFLRPGGFVVISVPNFRHYSVFAQLFLRGHVRYRDAGIFDRTHVRLTTRRMVCQWFSELGLEFIDCEHKMRQRRLRLLSWCTLGLLDEFLARQLIIVGRKPNA